METDDVQHEDIQTEQVDLIQQKQDDNADLFDALTNKNKDYMIKLNRALEKTTTVAERTVLFHQLLPEVIENQRKGITARQLYGTVAEKIATLSYEQSVLLEEQANEPSENWKLFLDSALMLGGLFSLVQGLTGMFDTSGPQGGSLGIVSLILNFVLGGFVGLVMTKFAPKKGVEKGFVKYLVVSTLAMLVWVIVMMGAIVLLPSSINVLISAPVILAIGLVSLGAKIGLKKWLNIQGTLM